MGGNGTADKAGGTSPSSGSTLASLILRPIILPRRNSPLSLQDAPLPCFQIAWKGLKTLVARGALLPTCSDSCVFWRLMRIWVLDDDLDEWRR